MMKAPICAVCDIPAEGCKPVVFFGRDVLVYRAEGQAMAVFNACVHLGGPLERHGNSFVCPWHKAEYDCATGMLKSGPSGTHDHLLTLPTAVEGGNLMYVYEE
jgi:nitrite reductase/ring-hydroxylating ferredoxin subunit